MTKTIILYIIIGLLTSVGNTYGQTNRSSSIVDIVHEALDFSVLQSLQMAYSLHDHPDLLPRTADPSGKLLTCHSDWWTSGFFPGVLWYMYEYLGTGELLTEAKEFTLRVEDQQYTTTTHDVGFIINCSYGNAYRLTHDKTYLPVIRNAANTLIKRFNPATGCIRSWDRAGWNKQWQYPVIIDNMMNLELLMVAAQLFNEPHYADIAVSHANITMKEHYRNDYSCFHVVSFDTLTGVPETKQTAQGYSDSSAWARGQSWGLYGFTMMYRFTGDAAYLNHATHIADFLIYHPNMPYDKIPFWDYNAPEIPLGLRDASAAAIMCSALIELSSYVSPDKAAEYLSVAGMQLRTLSSPAYHNALGTNGNFILDHSVGNMPDNSEVDVPLIYADYYFVEALMRYLTLRLK